MSIINRINYIINSPNLKYNQNRKSYNSRSTMYKSKLHELCQKRRWNFPAYATERVGGPDHNPRFSSKVTINGVCFETPRNQCRSSKEAQNMAAQLAFDHMINVVPPVKEVDSGFIASELTYTYRIRLQQYAQKHNLSLPVYYNEFEGPPHACRFRAKVTISGASYEFSEFFPTLKEAEHAAAKIAFETLSQEDIQEDERLYKIFLQEFAQKKLFQLPKYSTSQSGVSHHPIFVCTVQIGTDVFQGSEATTKKQAEMAAAKVAFNALLKRKEGQSPSKYHNLQSTINKELNQSVQEIAPNSPEMGESSVNKNQIISEQQSSKSQLNAQLQDPTPSTCSPSSATVKNPAKRVISETEHDNQAEAVKKPTRNVTVFSKDAETVIPEGASMISYSDQYFALMSK